MKVVLSIVLINFIIFAYSIPVYAKDRRTKSILEKSQRLKKHLRNLEEQILSHDEDISTPETVIPNPFISDEIASPTLPANATTTKPTQGTQVLGYGNFNTEKTSQDSAVSTIQISYSLLIYFTGRMPAKVITITLRVYFMVPASRRILQEEGYKLTYEDVETECTLNGEGTSEGTSSYDCSGNTKTEAAKVSNAKVNTNEDIKLDGEAAKPEELAFTGPAITEGEDLISNDVVIDTSAAFLTLTDGQLTIKEGNTFNVEGFVDNFNHQPKDVFDFALIHLNDGTKKIIECTVADPVEKVENTKSKVTFNCGPYNEFLNSTLDFATGSFKGTPADIITLDISEDSERAILLNDPTAKNQLTGKIMSGITITATVLSLIVFIIIFILTKL